MVLAIAGEFQNRAKLADNFPQGAELRREKERRERRGEERRGEVGGRTIRKISQALLYKHWRPMSS